MWNVRIIPFNTWNQMEPYAIDQASMDCINCPSMTFGAVADQMDGSYIVSMAPTIKGAYKVW